MKSKLIIAAVLVAVTSPSFAKGHGHAYHGSHHGKGFYHNQAHGDHGSMRSMGKGHK